MIAGDPGLEAWLHDTIRSAGPIPFARFMEAALYHPDHGYYCRPGATTGRAGDFYTSPDVHPAFGRLLARQIAEIADRTGGGRGEAFRIVEAGPGTGALARDIIEGLASERPALAAACSYTLVEISPTLRRLQQETLRASGAAAKIASVDWATWGEAIDGRPDGGLHGCVVANEFLDALPVHVVEVRDGRFMEVHVTSDGRRFGETLREIPDGALAAHLLLLREAEGVDPGEGHRAEIGLAGLEWVSSLARLFGEEGRGGAILVDYGHPAAELYGVSRRRGTLMCYHRHTAGEDPYARVGDQDMTAHVDFTSVERRARAAGFDAAPLRSQMMFLVSLGLAGMIADVASRPRQGVAEIRERLALHGLMAPGGMGEVFKVMLLARGARAADLTGARDPFRDAAADGRALPREGESVGRATA